MEKWIFIYNIVLYMIRTMKKNEAKERPVGPFRGHRGGCPILEQTPGRAEAGSIEGGSGGRPLQVGEQPVQRP